jgi:hypothetical protein
MQRLLLGTYYYASGEKYNGNWKDDIKEGHGVFYYSENEKYDGEWKNDHKCGKGTSKEEL